MKFDIDALAIIFFSATLTLLIVFALTYDSYGVYKDLILTFITVFSFVILLFEKIFKKK